MALLLTLCACKNRGNRWSAFLHKYKGTLSSLFTKYLRDLKKDNGDKEAILTYPLETLGKIFMGFCLYFLRIPVHDNLTLYYFFGGFFSSPEPYAREELVGYTDFVVHLNFQMTSSLKPLA